MAGLYIHIPFCEHKCLYCDFYSIAPAELQQNSSLLMEQFLFALQSEIDLRAQESREQTTYETVFFGGGTPSLLSPDQLEAILKQLAAHFSLSPDAEITLETNPGTVDNAKLHAFCSAGINRLSIGIQSFDNDDLNFLTRIHSSEEAKCCVRDAREAGFTNISIDLIFSLPGQTPERWRSNLEQALQLEPQHLSCYSLILEPGTPLYRMVEAKQVALLDTNQDAGLYEETMRFFAEHGFEHYEVSNFARPGFHSRHNLNYWNHTNYLGFGPSAHSFWNDKRWWNITNIQSYIEMLQTRRLPVSGSEQLTSAQLMEETIFLGLRSTGIDLNQFQQRFHKNFLETYSALLQTLLQEGLALLEQNRLRLTSKGYLLCDEICQKFR